jgi:hypothetical protein
LKARDTCRSVKNLQGLRRFYLTMGNYFMHSVKNHVNIICMNRHLPAFFLLLSALLIMPPPLWAQRVSIQKGLLSVDLREAPLISVAREIETQSGISFKGDESLLEERISLAFEDLPMEKGIKRILSTLNYSFLFDSQGEISEVIIMSAGGEPAEPQPQLRRAPVRPGTPMPPQRRPVVRRPGATSPLVSGERRTSVPTRSRTSAPQRSPQRPLQTVPPSPQASAESGLPEPFRTIDDAPSPGDIVEADGPLHPAFRVPERAEPPATTVRSPRETPKPASVEKDDRPKEEGDTSPQQD